MTANLNWIDYVFIGILFLSFLTGIWRGFFREIIGLLSWVAAFIVASLFASPLASAVSAHSSHSEHTVSLLALGASFFAIFIGVLIIGKIIGFFIASAAELGGVGFINRLFGAVFGFARGVLVVILFMILVDLTPFSEDSVWDQSMMVGYLQPAVTMVENTIHPDFEKLKKKVSETIEKASAAEKFEYSLNND
jgi:membrane protein required for colicin V production